MKTKQIACVGPTWSFHSNGPGILPDVRHLFDTPRTDKAANTSHGMFSDTETMGAVFREPYMEARDDDEHDWIWSRRSNRASGVVYTWVYVRQYRFFQRDWSILNLSQLEVTCKGSRTEVVTQGYRESIDLSRQIKPESPGSENRWPGTLRGAHINAKPYKTFTAPGLYQFPWFQAKCKNKYLTERGWRYSRPVSRLVSGSLIRPPSTSQESLNEARGGLTEEERKITPTVVYRQRPC